MPGHVALQALLEPVLGDRRRQHAREHDLAVLVLGDGQLQAHAGERLADRILQQRRRPDPDVDPAEHRLQRRNQLAALHLGLQIALDDDPIIAGPRGLAHLQGAAEAELVDDRLDLRLRRGRLGGLAGGIVTPEVPEVDPERACRKDQGQDRRRHGRPRPPAPGAARGALAGRGRGPRFRCRRARPFVRCGARGRRGRRLAVGAVGRRGLGPGQGDVRPRRVRRPERERGLAHQHRLEVGDHDAAVDLRAIDRDRAVAGLDRDLIVAQDQERVPRREPAVAQHDVAVLVGADRIATGPQRHLGPEMRAGQNPQQPCLAHRSVPGVWPVPVGRALHHVLPDVDRGRRCQVRRACVDPADDVGRRTGSLRRGHSFAIARSLAP